jgi:hypothetical protein
MIEGSVLLHLTFLNIVVLIGSKAQNVCVHWTTEETTQPRKLLFLCQTQVPLLENMSQLVRHPFADTLVSYFDALLLPSHLLSL